MTLHNNNDIKVSNGKFFIYSRMQCRFFPISKVNALENIAIGKSVLINNLTINN
jgi:hypothetical protein